ncbi:MAG: hypothetical protein V7K32_28120 [Nostoc sp.]
MTRHLRSRGTIHLPKPDKGDACFGLRQRKKTSLMYYVKQVARPPAWALS